MWWWLSWDCVFSKIRLLINIAVCRLSCRQDFFQPSYYARVQFGCPVVLSFKLMRMSFTCKLSFTLSPPLRRRMDFLLSKQARTGLRFHPTITLSSSLTAARTSQPEFCYCCPLSLRSVFAFIIYLIGNDSHRRHTVSLARASACRSRPGDGSVRSGWGGVAFFGRCGRRCGVVVSLLI